MVHYAEEMADNPIARRSGMCVGTIIKATTLSHAKGVQLFSWSSDDHYNRMTLHNVWWFHSFFVPTRASTLQYIQVPLWIPMLIFLLLPTLSACALHRRRKRRKLGLCLCCGYDLRGSSERCPECGKGFSK